LAFVLSMRPDSVTTQTPPSWLWPMVNALVFMS
jgi:hypothetical protein